MMLQECLLSQQYVCVREGVLAASLCPHWVIINRSSVYVCLVHEVNLTHYLSFTTQQSGSLDVQYVLIRPRLFDLVQDIWFQSIF